MLSAQTALSDLERAILGVRRDEDRLTAMLSQATGELDRLRGEKTEAFRALARLRLDAIAGNEVVGQLEGAERRALAALNARRQKLDETRESRVAAAKKLDDLEGERLEAARVRDGAIAAVDTMTDAVEAEVKTEADWQALDAAVGSSRDKAVAARDKATRAEEDRVEKGHPYEADRLFMYLWKSGYGTSTYRAGSLVRYFDGKVARLIGFDAARPNYFMLNEIPLRLGEHAGRLEADVKVEEDKRAAYERAALVKAGVEPLEAEVKKAAEGLAKIEGAMDRVRSDLAVIDGELKGLMDPVADPAVKGAVEELASTLERADLAELWRKAQATHTPEDDRIVSDLKRNERDTVRLNAQIEELRKSAVDLARKRDDLESSRDYFRTRGYDRRPGGFSNGDLIGGLIQGVIQGAITAAVLKGAFDHGYHPNRHDNGFGGGFGGGLGGGPWGGGGSGGDSGGGFSGGGGFGGGDDGFSTGGGF